MHAMVHNIQKELSFNPAFLLRNETINNGSIFRVFFLPFLTAHEGRKHENQLGDIVWRGRRSGNKLSNKFISSQHIDCVQAMPNALFPLKKRYS
jgi:hypothetical protein